MYVFIFLLCVGMFVVDMLDLVEYVVKKECMWWLIEVVKVLECVFSVLQVGEEFVVFWEEECEGLFCGIFDNYVCVVFELIFGVLDF